MAKIVAVCTSPKKGMRKNVGESNMLVDLGLEGCPCRLCPQAGKSFGPRKYR